MNLCSRLKKIPLPSSGGASPKEESLATAQALLALIDLFINFSFSPTFYSYLFIFFTGF